MRVWKIDVGALRIDFIGELHAVNRLRPKHVQRSLDLAHFLNAANVGGQGEHSTGVADFINWPFHKANLR